MYIKLAVRGQILFDANVKCDVNNETAIRQTKKIYTANQEEGKELLLLGALDRLTINNSGPQETRYSREIGSGFSKKKTEKETN